MKYLSIALLFTFIVACESTPKETTETVNVDETVEQVEEEVPAKTQEEMERSSKSLIAKVLEVEALGLNLDQDKKWQVNDQIFTDLMKIKQQIYIISGNMENYEIASYNEMGNEFLGFVEGIPTTNNESSNTELQKVVSASKEQCMHLLGSNLQSAQIAVINLSIIYDAVPNYFESVQK